MQRKLKALFFSVPPPTFTLRSLAHAKDGNIYLTYATPGRFMGVDEVVVAGFGVIVIIYLSSNVAIICRGNDDIPILPLGRDE